MITLTKDLSEAKFVTHAGNFHADDVFSTVFMSRYFGNITVIRLKDYEDNDLSKIAYDIGRGKFDHHQAGYDKKHSNGIHYCGFGLLWQEYGLDYLKKLNVSNFEDVFKVFDYLLVTNIDAFDNGEADIDKDYNIYTIPSLIEMFRPRMDTNEDEDECFLKACRFAEFLFDRILEDAIIKVKVINKVRNLSNSIRNKILVLDEFIPYEYAIFYLNLDVDFVVYPSNRGGWAARSVPTHYKGFIKRVPFKEEWAGLRDGELAKVSGIETAKFCHNKLFLFTADTREDALKAAEICEINNIDF